MCIICSVRSKKKWLSLRFLRAHLLFYILKATVTKFTFYHVTSVFCQIPIERPRYMLCTPLCPIFSFLIGNQLDVIQGQHLKVHVKTPLIRISQLVSFHLCFVSSQINILFYHLKNTFYHLKSTFLKEWVLRRIKLKMSHF